MITRLVIGILLTLVTFSLRAAPATIYFADGRVITGELIAVERGQIQWKVDAASTRKISTLRSQIDHVEFPLTPEWSKAESLFESGLIEEAVKAYREVIAAAKQNYHPFPGNFASRAKVKLLECARLGMDPSEISKQAAAVRKEFPHLPEHMRRFDPEVQAWVDVAKERWDKVFADLSHEAAPTPESFFLKARALEGQGKTAEAIGAYAGVYTLNFGGSTKLTEEALKRSITLYAVLGNEDRVGETRAQAKIYKEIFGAGALWEGASSEVVALAEEKLTVAKEPNSELDEVEAPMDSTGVIGNAQTVPDAEKEAE